MKTTLFLTCAAVLLLSVIAGVRIDVLLSFQGNDMMTGLQGEGAGRMRELLGHDPDAFEQLVAAARERGPAGIVPDLGMGVDVAADVDVVWERALFAQLQADRNVAGRSAGRDQRLTGGPLRVRLRDEEMERARSEVEAVQRYRR